MKLEETQKIDLPKDPKRNESKVEKENDLKTKDIKEKKESNSSKPNKSVATKSAYKMNKTIMWAGVGVLSAGLVATAIAVPLAVKDSDHNNNHDGLKFNFGDEYDLKNPQIKAGIKNLSDTAKKVSPLTTGEDVDKVFHTDKTISLQYKNDDTSATYDELKGAGAKFNNAASPDSQKVSGVKAIITVEFDKTTGELNRVITQFSGTENGNRVDDLTVEVDSPKNSTDETTIKLNNKIITPYNAREILGAVVSNTAIKIETNEIKTFETIASKDYAAEKAEAVKKAKIDLEKLKPSYYDSETIESDDRAKLDTLRAKIEKAIEDVVSSFDDAKTAQEVVTAAGNTQDILNTVDEYNEAYKDAIANHEIAEQGRATVKAIENSKGILQLMMVPELQTGSVGATDEFGLELLRTAVQDEINKLSSEIEGMTDIKTIEEAVLDDSKLQPIKDAVKAYEDLLKTKEAAYAKAHFITVKIVAQQEINAYVGKYDSKVKGPLAKAEFIIYTAVVSAGQDSVTDPNITADTIADIVAAAKVKIEAAADKLIEAIAKDDAIAEIKAITIPAKTTIDPNVAEDSVSPQYPSWSEPANLETLDLDAIESAKAEKEQARLDAESFNVNYEAAVAAHEVVLLDIANEVTKLDAIIIPAKVADVPGVSVSETYPAAFTKPASFATVAEVTKAINDKQALATQATAYNVAYADAIKAAADKAQADKDKAAALASELKDLRAISVPAKAADVTGVTVTETYPSYTEASDLNTIDKVKSEIAKKEQAVTDANAYNTAYAAAVKTKADGDAAAAQAAADKAKLDSEIAAKVAELDAITIPDEATTVAGVTAPTPAYSNAYTKPATFATIAEVTAEIAKKQALADAAKKYNEDYAKAVTAKTTADANAAQLAKDIATEVAKLDAITIPDEATAVAGVTAPTPAYPAAYVKPTSFKTVAEVTAAIAAKQKVADEATAYNTAHAKAVKDKLADDLKKASDKAAAQLAVDIAAEVAKLDAITIPDEAAVVPGVTAPTPAYPSAYVKPASFATVAEVTAAITTKQKVADDATAYNTAYAKAAAAKAAKDAAATKLAEDIAAEVAKLDAIVIPAKAADVTGVTVTEAYPSYTAKTSFKTVAEVTAEITKKQKAADEATAYNAAYATAVAVKADADKLVADIAAEKIKLDGITIPDKAAAVAGVPEVTPAYPSYTAKTTFKTVAEVTAEIAKKQKAADEATAYNTKYAAAVATKVAADAKAAEEKVAADKLAADIDAKVAELDAIVIDPEVATVDGVTAPTPAYPAAYVKPTSFKTVAEVTAAITAKQKVADAATAYNTAYATAVKAKADADKLVADLKAAKTAAIAGLPKVVAKNAADKDEAKDEYDAMVKAYDDAKDAINRSTTVKSVNATATSRATGITNAITAYQDAVTANRLARKLVKAKTDAIKALTKAVAKDTKLPDAAADEFAAIATEISTATDAINAATDVAEVTQARTDGNVAIDAANTAYTDAVQVAQDVIDKATAAKAAADKAAADKAAADAKTAADKVAADKAAEEKATADKAAADAATLVIVKAEATRVGGLTATEIDAAPTPVTKNTALTQDIADALLGKDVLVLDLTKFAYKYKVTATDITIVVLDKKDTKIKQTAKKIALVIKAAAPDPAADEPVIDASDIY